MTQASKRFKRLVLEVWGRDQSGHEMRRIIEGELAVNAPRGESYLTLLHEAVALWAGSDDADEFVERFERDILNR